MCTILHSSIVHNPRDINTKDGCSENPQTGCFAAQSADLSHRRPNFPAVQTVNLKQNL